MYERKCPILSYESHMAILILVFITLAGLQLQCAALRTEAVTGNLSLIASMLSTGW